MPQRFSLPPVITASKWATVWSNLWQNAPRGLASDGAGGFAPAWTNREALSVISGLRELAKGSAAGFPLWYQFAAIAYGWSPESDTLTATSSQADDDYPIDAAVSLGDELKRIAGDLDKSSHPNPRMALADVFDNRELLQEVSVALRQDGADAAFKVPLPACKDPVTGKPARPVKDAAGKWKCPGGALTIDDPITAFLKMLEPLIIPAGIILILAAAAGTKTRRGRRRR